MKTILVPVDFSEFSLEIINHATNIGKLSGGTVHLMHVATLDLGVIVGETGFTYLPELEKTALSEEAERMQKYKDLVEKEGVKCETIVRQGIPTELILQEAKELNADLIVIGSLGHNAFYKVFIGSVASDVIKHSNIPMLVVPKKKEESNVD